MTDWDFLLAPSTVNVRILLNEAGIVITSLKLLNVIQMHSGLGEWVSRTYELLTDDQRRVNHVFADVADFVPQIYTALAQSKNMTFLEFIDALVACDPMDLREGVLHGIREKGDYPGDEYVLSSKEAFIRHMYEVLSHKIAHEDQFDEAVWALRYEYYQNPQMMVSELSAFLHLMWNNHLKEEWRRTRPMLEEATDAFASLDYSDMTAFDVIETLSGRNMRGNEKFEEILTEVETLIFLPSPHLGPYIGWGPCQDARTLILVIGARLPKNATMQSQALSRSELLVRLNALADETRLKILELLTQQEELCAQDFITMLDLSQSSASRHLRQLTASGYVSERRRDVAKCYSLNRDRLDDTIRALKEFLRKA